ncbi:DUF1294 domain-containing protein [Shimia abyssi]|uniref:Uncharacterized membrane protein YsdA (DUF1294 family) n=1 Tax=Shimia abyssi TaxID=1662395 RepID=A0A2P8FIZ9_9RHOB|nr:DUF1294 domain-containing protein [Shimia abyssi]PSL21686.1 uncharacterized membrane protein YsdA (DUF1294 family) [Shimia abyssi]
MADLLPRLFQDHGPLIVVGAVLIFFLLMNTLACILFAVDSHQADADKRRVSGGAFLGLALIGGSLGALWGRIRFGHASQSAGLTFALLFILTAQVGAVAVWQSPYAPQVQAYALDKFASLLPQEEEEEVVRTLPRRFGPGS